MNQWASDYAAWTDGIEAARYEYDRRRPGHRVPARRWFLAEVRAVYDYAITHPNNPRQRPHHTSAPHRCEHVKCARLNREWFRVYARQRAEKARRTNPQNVCG